MSLGISLRPPMGEAYTPASSTPASGGNPQGAAPAAFALAEAGSQPQIEFTKPAAEAANAGSGQLQASAGSGVTQLLNALLKAVMQALATLTQGGQGQQPSVAAQPESNTGSSSAAAPQASASPTSGGGPSTGGSAKGGGQPVVLDHTIKVGPGETFDGHNQTFTASSALGSGDQREDQKPLFELAEGATLKNVTLGDNEADGIHVVAATGAPVTVDNLHAKNVGEDLLTVKPEGGAKVTNLNILNSSAEHAADKIFQLNANAHVKVDGFKADDFGTFMRTNGGHQFSDMQLDLNDVQASHGKFSFVKSDSENLGLSTHGIALSDVQHPYDKTTASTRHTGE